MMNNIDVLKELKDDYRNDKRIVGALDRAIEALGKDSGCTGCWVWESNMNWERCKGCGRNYGDKYIGVTDKGGDEDWGKIK